MISAQQLDETVDWNGLKEFGVFILSHCEPDRLPDYTLIDLMRIPQLVPYIWVYDLRNFANDRKLQVNFAGEEFTKMFERNIMGESETTIFRDQPIFDDVTEFYRKCIDDNLVGYTMRFGDHALHTQDDQKFRQAESLFFPCSSDRKTIDWGIGCVIFKFSSFEHENIFLHF